MITVYLIEFLLFSVLGWLIDSGYRSLVDRTWINAGYFRGPLCPIYGFGGLTLMFVFTYLHFPPAVLIVISVLALVLTEYLGGIFCEKALKVRLWDYSTSRYHVGGRIDLLHTGYWVALVILFYYFFVPLIRRLEQAITAPEIIELPLFVIVIVLALWLTMRRSPAHYLEITNSVMNITVEKYQQLFTTITKLTHTASSSKRKELLDSIRRQLYHTGARLKEKWKTNKTEK